MNLGSVMNVMNTVSIVASFIIMNRLKGHKDRANLKGLFIYFISEIIGNGLVILSDICLSLPNKLFFFNFLFTFFVMGSCGWFIWYDSFVNNTKTIGKLGRALLSLPIIVFLVTIYLTITQGVGFLTINPQMECHHGFLFLVFQDFSPLAFVFLSMNFLIVLFIIFSSVTNIEKMKKIKRRYYLFSMLTSVVFIIVIGLYLKFRSLFPYISLFDVALFLMLIVKFMVLSQPYTSAAVDLKITDRYALIENMFQGLLVVDSDGELLDYNSAAKRIMDRIGVRDFAKSQDVFHVLSSVFPEFSPKKNIGTEIEYITYLPDGKNAVFEISMDRIGAVKDEEGIGPYVVSLRDITADKGQQLDLHIFKTSFYAVNDMMLICQPSGDIEYASSGFTDSTGFTEKEAKGKYFLDIKLPNDQTFKSIHEALGEKKPWNGYVRSMRKTGEEMLEKMSISPILGAAENLLGFTVISKDITTELIQVSQLEKEAGEDFLTKALNRRTFISSAIELLEQAEKEKGEATVFMIDIDHFKAVNDTYGHDAGDEVLKGLCQLVRSLIREQDVFARYGGEEFALVFAMISREQMLEFAERLRQAIERMVTNYKGKTIRVTVSIGICHMQEGHYDLQTMLKHADEALYMAKNAGRNRVMVSNNKDI